MDKVRLATVCDEEVPQDAEHNDACSIHILHFRASPFTVLLRHLQCAVVHGHDALRELVDAARNADQSADSSTLAWVCSESIHAHDRHKYDERTLNHHFLPALRSKGSEQVRMWRFDAYNCKVLKMALSLHQYWYWMTLHTTTGQLSLYTVCGSSI